MMRHFDMKRYPRERGKKFIHYFGEAIIQGGRLFEGGLLFKEIRYVFFTFHVYNITIQK